MNKILFITGAGTGVESGIRAFRVDTESGKSMWDEYDVEEVCNYPKFMSDSGVYNKTNEFYNKRRVELKGVSPNAFHISVAAMYKDFPDNILNITTNVDDLLERAGVAKTDILHVHGYLPEIVYLKDGIKVIENVGYNEVDIGSYSWVKPNVVFFGEAAPLYEDMAIAVNSLKSGDRIIIVGCSNKVIDFISFVGYLVVKGIKVDYVDPFIADEDRQYCDEWGIGWHKLTAVEFANTELKQIEKEFYQGAN